MQKVIDYQKLSNFIFESFKDHRKIEDRSEAAGYIIALDKAQEFIDKNQQEIQTDAD
jgi:hypothetical protein